MNPDFEAEGVQLYCGDCIEILPKLSGIDSVITDPTYGVNFSGKNTKHTDRNEITYSDNGFTESHRVVVSFECRSKLIFSGVELIYDYPKPDAMGCVYTPSGAGVGKWGFGMFHPILYYGKCPYTASRKGSRPNGFESFAVIREEINHPCPKPVEWMIWAVNRASLEGELILDPYMGSGTTGIACIRTKRRFIGIEIDEKHFQTSKERIERELLQGVFSF